MIVVLTISTVAALGQEEDEQRLAELKKAHDLNTSSLSNELRRLHERFSVATVDLEQKTAHLADTILANHKLVTDAKSRSTDADSEEARQNKKDMEALQQVGDLPRWVSRSTLTAVPSITNSKNLPLQTCSVVSRQLKKLVRMHKR